MRARTRRGYADVRDFLGRPLADVRVEVGGRRYTEPSVLQLIETRVGEPLSMEHVRETIDHLVGLGRFEDVRVFAEPRRRAPDARRRCAGCSCRCSASAAIEIDGTLEL